MYLGKTKLAINHLNLIKQHLRFPRQIIYILE
jgi:hypothetical protein